MENQDEIIIAEADSTTYPYRSPSPSLQRSESAWSVDTIPINGVYEDQEPDSTTCDTPERLSPNLLDGMYKVIKNIIFFIFIKKYYFRRNLRLVYFFTGYVPPPFPFPENIGNVRDEHLLDGMYSFIKIVFYLTISDVVEDCSIFSQGMYRHRSRSHRTSETSGTSF